MGEFSCTIFSACVSVLVIDLLSQLFPDRSDSFVRGCAVLLVCASVLIGFLRMDREFTAAPSNDYISEVSEEDMKQNTIEYGIELLKQRLHSVLDSAGIALADNGISIQYRLSEDEIEIDRVLVRLRYSTDAERAYSILQSVLTEMIPVEVYVD